MWRNLGTPVTQQLQLDWISAPTSRTQELFPRETVPTEDREAEPEPEEPETPPEEPKEPEKPQNAAEIPDEKYGEVKRLEGETNKEFAYRIEISRLRGEKRKEQVGEIMQPPPQPAKKELSPEKQKVLSKYKKEDLDTLKEVFDVMAEDMGLLNIQKYQNQKYQNL